MEICDTNDTTNINCGSVCAAHTVRNTDLSTRCTSPAALPREQTHTSDSPWIEGASSPQSLLPFAPLPAGILQDSPLNVQ